MLELIKKIKNNIENNINNIKAIIINYIKIKKITILFVSKKS